MKSLHQQGRQLAYRYLTLWQKPRVDPGSHDEWLEKEVEWFERNLSPEAFTGLSDGFCQVTGFPLLHK